MTDRQLTTLVAAIIANGNLDEIYNGNISIDEVVKIARNISDNVTKSYLG